MARTAHAVGSKVIAVTMIARNGWFGDGAHKQPFPANQSALNHLLFEFDRIRFCGRSVWLSWQCQFALLLRR
jgi:hypothetical protein